MLSNLPPGVHVSDIPGNRPDDRVAEAVTALVMAMSLDDFVDRVGPDEHLAALVANIIDRETDAAIAAWLGDEHATSRRIEYGFACDGFPNLDPDG